MILQFALSFVNKLITEPELTQGGSLELRQQHMPHWINLHTPNTFSLQSQHAAYVLPVVVKKIWSRWEYKEVKKEFSLSISKELFLSNLYATHWLWMLLLLPKCLISDNLTLIEILQLFVSSFIRLPFIFLPLLTQTSAYTKEKIKLHEMIIEAFLLGHKGVENDPDELWKIW